MKYARQERPPSMQPADTGEQNHLEMFGAIGLARGLPQTTANIGRVNQREGRIRKNRNWLPMSDSKLRTGVNSGLTPC